MSSRRVPKSGQQDLLISRLWTFSYGEKMYATQLTTIVDLNAN